MRVILFLWSVALVARTPVKLVVSPENPLLFGQGSRQALTAVAHYAGGFEEDVTAKARFVSDKPSIASVEGAVITARGNGGARIHASYAGLNGVTTALVQRAEAPPPGSFSADIMPVLTKLGCNGGSCHGALNGQNGFKLSLFGYEPEADYEMIFKRVNLAAPARSLFLLKPTFEVKHGGGKLLRPGSAEYSTLLDWIAGGAKRIPAEERRIAALRIYPKSSVLFGGGARRQLLVTARYTDGAERDITTLVRFQSNDDSIARVSADGVVTAARPGETAIVVRAPGIAAAAKIGVVLQARRFDAPEPANFIDRHVFAKLKALHIPPSEICDDATFLRRASLDIVGLIPTAEETRRFLASNDPNKRQRLVDELLQRPEYADHWALYWGDHLSNTRQLLYNKGPYTFTRWLYDAFRTNMRYDAFVRELLTSSGNMYTAPATSYYPLMRKELDLAATTSQLFLGVSIECARCHNHPLDRWTQNDFNGMAAFFGQVRYKGGAGPRNNERILWVDFKRHFQHPETKQTFVPKPLDGPYFPADEQRDRREMLAGWMTAPGNPFFAKAIANRMWRNFMGRGLVEPVDDFRVTNPATNQPLLDALAEDFAAHGYDLHHIIRRITSSKTYQLSSRPNDGNRDDTMSYARRYSRRLTAEQLLDSISQATGVPEPYKSLYPGTRAMQVPDPEVESYFLDVFDRPSRQNVCERKQPPTLNQTLHLIGGEGIQNKIAHPRGALARLVAAGRSTDQIVEELYLRTLARLPDQAERALAAAAVAKASTPKQGFEDVFWALLNSKEFLYNH
jgi:hypothetical protein